MGHLRWKYNKKQTGLSAIGAGPLGSYLHDGETKFATVSATRSKGWFWVAGWDSGIPYKNTCNCAVATEAQAKADALEYVKIEIKKLAEGE